MSFLALLAAVFSIVGTGIVRILDRCAVVVDLVVLNLRRKSVFRGFRASPALVLNGPGWSGDREE